MASLHHRRGRFASAALIAFLAPLIIVPASILLAQDAPVPMGPNGQPMQLSPEQMEAMRKARGGQPPGPPGGPPGQPPKPDGEKKPEGDDAKKKEEGSATVKRPEKPPRVPDPREFKVTLDAQGRVPPFNFIGQPWPDVMQWFATLAKCSLDWQELPSDYLNLTTQRAYTVDEVRDLLNRHLNARGFISIQSGEVLSVFKVDKLDPSIVRRVTEDQLYDLKPYDFVKVSFELPPSLEVDKAKEDVKQVLNPTAKIFPLVASKRLLVMDSVANLRTVSELLNQERMIADGRIVPKEFVLKHARPEKVIDILYVVLGMDPKSRPTQMDLQLQQQKLQIMMQMQQRGTDVSKMLKQDGPPVYLAFNRQRNSVLVNAPPEQMKVIEQTIQYLDVPFGSPETGAATAAAAKTSDNQRVMKKYPLTTLDPDNFVTTLEEIGGLSPSAEFKVDKESKTLFALATAADHVRINGLIDQFDGTGRHFEVIQLRRRPADAVAATIYKLMGGQEKEDEDSNRRRWWSPWDDDFRNDKKKQLKGFGIDADIENNQLLVWANDAEMQRVRDLLVQLGETPGPKRDSRPMRIIEPTDAKSTAALLEQLRTAWPAARGNPLIIKGREPHPAADEDQDKKDKKDQPAPQSNPAAKPKEDRASALNDELKVAVKFAELQSAANEKKTPDSTAVTTNPAANEGVQLPQKPAADDGKVTAAKPVPTEGADAASPVTITITDDGRLLLSSPDTAALDRLEDLITELSPPDRRFKVIQIRYVRASEIFYDLTDYFKDDMEGDSNGYMRDWYGFMVPKGNKTDAGTGLSKRRKLMITYDRPSNSILIANASPSQLKEIDQLIEEFDKPARGDSVEIRQTAAIKIRYSRPSVIAAAVKEVYRDLLSSKDKEFERSNKKDERSLSERMTVISYGGGSQQAESGNERSSPMKVGFDGALSLGADDVSGVLIVSAQKVIFNDIVKMVEELDEQAAPRTTVQVYHTNGNISAKSLQDTVNRAVGSAWLGQRPEQLPNQKGPNAGNKPGKGNRGRNQPSQDNQPAENVDAAQPAANSGE